MLCLCVNEADHFLNTSQVEMEISGATTKLCGELPIIIGTIPLRATFSNLRLPPPPPPQLPPVLPLQSPKSEQSHIKGQDDGVPLNAGEPLASAPPYFDNYPDLRNPSSDFTQLHGHGE